MAYDTVKGKMKLTWLRIVLIVIGLACIVYTGFLVMHSNFNLGVMLPAVIGTPLVLYGVFFLQINAWRDMLGFMRTGVFIIYALFILIIAIASICMFTVPTANMKEDADVIIVLGAAVRNGKVTKTLQQRLDLAYEYLVEHEETMCVVSGGQGPQESMAEGDAMAAYLLEKGIHKDRILIEDEAASTEQNFAFSYAILQEHFDSPKDLKVIFITSDFHVYRATKNAHKHFTNIKGMGNTSISYMLPSFVLRESLALAHMFVFGA